MTFQNKELHPERSARDLYGCELREYRNRAGLSLAALAGILNFSKTHLGNIETADRAIPPGLSEKLDAAFGTDGHFTRLYQLARREPHPGKYRRFMELEDQSDAVWEYAGHTVPGLLQTADYARARFEIGNPDADRPEIDSLVSARLGRQERLRGRGSTHLHVVLDEAVLRRPIGRTDVMREQVEALIAAVDTPRTTVQVIPFAHGGHPLLGGSMIVLRLIDRSTVIYLEGIESGKVVEDYDDVSRRLRAYDRARAYALSTVETRTFLAASLEEYRS